MQSTSSHGKEHRKMPELVAPAGTPDVLQAALHAGADAVYSGLQVLNARRTARNFTATELPDIVNRVHDAGARIYVTLNVAVTERERSLASRALALCSDAGVDAVMVTDPLFLQLKTCFPELPFHWSTQAGVSNSAGMAAAQRQGLDRVVLAREMSCDEIREASRVNGVETEVFVQGALCFCMSGRCLLSSWGGGRSGNRGLCTSPCRVEWSAENGPSGRFLSMHDLCLLDRIHDLAAAGVNALKIEGRLKSPEWVQQAVSVYRHVLDGGAAEEVRQKAQQLGSYTGRRLTSGYFDGRRSGLQGDAGRVGRFSEDTGSAKDSQTTEDAALDRNPEGTVAGQQSSRKPLLEVNTGQGRLDCRFIAGDSSENVQFPLSKIKRPNKAVSVDELPRWFAARKSELPEVELTADNVEQLIPRRTANALADRFAAFFRRAQEGIRQERRVEYPLPENVQKAIKTSGKCSSNQQELGHAVNRVCIPADTETVCAAEWHGLEKVVEDPAPEWVEQYAPDLRNEHLIIALPHVVFEQQMQRVLSLVRIAAQQDWRVEVNGWDSLEVARQEGVAFECGPGMSVYNAVAARALRDAGARAVTASVELDRVQLEELCRDCEVPLCLHVFARPVLMTTRAALPEELTNGTVVYDARGIRMQLEALPAYNRFRAVQAFDLTAIRNPQVKAWRLVADLTGSPDVLGEWHELTRAASRSPFHFNYDRRLK